MVYPEHYVIRKVHSQGDIRWKGRQFYFSETLAGELIGCHQIDDSLWEIYFGPIHLANLDTRNHHVIKMRKTYIKTQPDDQKVLTMCPV